MAARTLLTRYAHKGVSVHVEWTPVLGLSAQQSKPDAGHAVVAKYNRVRDATQLRSVIGLAGQDAAVDALLTGEITSLSLRGLLSSCLGSAGVDESR